MKKKTKKKLLVKHYAELVLEYDEEIDPQEVINNTDVDFVIYCHPISHYEVQFGYFEIIPQKEDKVNEET